MNTLHRVAQTKRHFQNIDSYLFGIKINSPAKIRRKAVPLLGLFETRFDPTSSKLLFLLKFLGRCPHGRTSFSLKVRERRGDRIILTDKWQRAPSVEILHLKQFFSNIMFAHKWPLLVLNTVCPTASVY